MESGNVIGPGNFENYSEMRDRAGSMDARPMAERQRELTQCFFAEWQAIESGISIVILFDTYEGAAPATKDWIENQFLEGVKKY